MTASYEAIKKFYIRTVTVSSPDVLYTVTGDAGVTVGPSTTTVTGFLDDPDPIDTNHLDELNANGDFGSSTIEFNSIGASTGIFLDFAVGDTIGLTVKAVSDNEPDPTDTLSGVYIIDASDNSPGAEIWSLKFPDGSSPSFGFVTRNFLAYRCILTPRRYLTESDRIDIFEPDDFEPQNLKVVRNVQEFSSVELVAPGDVEDQITIDSPTDVIFSNSADTIVSTDSQFDDIAVSSNIGTCISIKPGGFDNDNRLYYIHDNNNAGGTRTLSIKPTPVSDIIEDETVTDITLIEYTVPAGDALKGSGTTTFTVTGYQLVTASAPTNPEDRPLKGDVIALSFDNDGDHAGAGLFIVSNEPIFADPPNGVTMELVNLDGSLPQTIVSGLVTRWYIVRPIEPEAPFLTPVSSTELWVDFEFLQGLYQNNNGVKNVNAIELEILYTESDINGNPLASTERETVTFSSRSSGKLRFTHKIDVSDDEGFYNVSASRITAKGADSSTQVFVDDVRWVRLAGVNNLFEAFDPRIIDHGDITTVRIISQITSSTTIVPQRSLNTEVTRLLEAFKQDGTNVNPATGAAASPGDKFPTQRFADIFIYRATDSFGVNLSTDEIDFDSIYDIQDELTAYTPVSGPLEPEQGEFNFTFDRRISSDQELRAITNIVRCSVFRIGSEVSIIRDEGDRLPISLFNRRNKSPEGETKTFDFNQRNSHDGVEVTFVSSEIAYREVTFVLGFGVGALVVVNPSPRPLNAKKLRLDGVITWDQAYRRGAYELNRIRFRRDRLTMKVTEDARVLGLNSIVAVSDNLQSPTVDGEVLEIDSSVSTATIVTLDQDVSFGAGTEVITLRDLNGDETQTFLALAGAESNIVIIDLTSDIDTNPLSIELGTSDGTSVGNLYQFYITGSDEIGNYLVEDIDIADEYVRVVLSNYDEDVFANDFIALPTPPLPIT